MLLVAGYARREHLREVEISKVEQLIKEHGVQFNVPPYIWGTMTKVTNAFLERSMKLATRVVHIIDDSPHELLLTDSEQTGGARNFSIESLRINLSESIAAASSSDFVSTLRDPNESDYMLE